MANRVRASQVRMASHKFTIRESTFVITERFLCLLDALGKDIGAINSTPTMIPVLNQD